MAANKSCTICSKSNGKIVGSTNVLKWLGFPVKEGAAAYAHPACVSIARKERRDRLAKEAPSGPKAPRKAPAQSPIPAKPGMGVSDSPSPVPLRPIPPRREGFDLRGTRVPDKVGGWAVSIIEHGLLKAAKGKKVYTFPNMVHLNNALRKDMR